MYVEGKGVPRDDVEPYARFTVAVALGHDGAAKNIAKLDRLLSEPHKTEGQAIAKRSLASLKTIQKN
jgi:TPR repeat protein